MTPIRTITAPLISRVLATSRDAAIAVRAEAERRGDRETVAWIDAKLREAGNA